MCFPFLNFLIKIKMKNIKIFLNKKIKKPNKCDTWRSQGERNSKSKEKGENIYIYRSQSLFLSFIFYVLNINYIKYVNLTSIICFN